MLRLTVEGMSCDPCVRAITRAGPALAHGKGVPVDLPPAAARGA